MLVSSPGRRFLLGGNPHRRGHFHLLLGVCHGFLNQDALRQNIRKGLRVGGAHAFVRQRRNPARFPHQNHRALLARYRLGRGFQALGLFKRHLGIRRAFRRQTAFQAAKSPTQ